MYKRGVSVLTYGVDIEHLKVFPQNPLLSDHNLITFEFLLPEFTPWVKSFYTRCLTDSAVAKFKEAIPSAFDSIPRLNITENSWSNFSPSQIDHLVDSATGSLRMTLDSIAPLKRKTVRKRRFAPWYNPQTRKLKQTSRKLERIWRSTNLEESRLVWRDSLKTYKKALRNARAAYYSSVICHVVDKTVFPMFPCPSVSCVFTLSV